MKKVIVSLLTVFILIMFIPSINVYASDYDASDYGYEEYEDYTDGDTEQVYTWVHNLHHRSFHLHKSRYFQDWCRYIIAQVP